MIRLFALHTVRGPWLSFGAHLHFWPPKEAHFDLHLGWWILTLGPGAECLRRAEEEFTRAMYAAIAIRGAIVRQQSKCGAALPEQTQVIESWSGVRPV